VSGTADGRPPGGRLLLLSDGWTPTEGVVFVIDDDEPIRIEFVQDVP
jgi:hypothetical protein